MQRIVIWTDTAKREYLGTISQLKIIRGEDNKSIKKLITDTTKTVKMIASFPFIGGIANEVRNKEVRKIVITANYSLFYELTENEIIITAFWDNRQDSKKLKNIL